MMLVTLHALYSLPNTEPSGCGIISPKTYVSDVEDDAHCKSNPMNPRIVPRR
jgi:hypothetical protein